ncbi:MAG: alpha/beta hydrolase [Chloroflexota bacterium]
MRYLTFLAILVLSGVLAISVMAQDVPDDFESFSDERFAVQGIVPEGWASATPGVYQRGQDASDATAIIIQSAPLPLATLQETLTAQLGVDEFPEPTGEVTTDFTTWTVYRVDNETFGLSITVALTEVDSTSYLVILQSPSDEHDELVERVFNPVVDSIRPLAVESETSDEEDMSVDVPYTEEEVTFSNGDTTLAGTLTIPNEGDAFPVVVIVSGSGAQDRTGSLAPLAEIDMYTQIADGLARQGIAVLRYDDRGVGESTTDTTNPSLFDFRNDAFAATQFLAERDEFTHIGIAGHSEGGVYAPEIALGADTVDFVIGLNAPTVNLIEVAIYQQNAFGQLAGVPEETLQAIETAYRDVVALLGTDDMTEETLRAAVTELVNLQTGSEQPDSVVDAGMAQFLSAIIQSYAEYNPTPFWLEVDVPTLTIFGSLDLQVAPEQNVPVIEGENDNIDIVIIEGMNHIFQEAETGALSEYGTLEQVVMPELIDTMAEWILDVTTE